MCATIALAAGFLSEHYGGPVMLFALLLGTAFNFLSTESKCKAGIEIAATSVLRVGVALLGLRVSLNILSDFGWSLPFLLLAAVVLTIASGYAYSKILGLRGQFGILTGGAVAICGASAALALSSILPKHEHSQSDTIFTVVGVTTLSTLAMIVYPAVTQSLQFTDADAGIFLGATIHDVAQVVGAGYMVSESTGDTATLVKLMRVSILIPVMLIILLFCFNKKTCDDDAPRLPWFLVGFVGCVLINSYALLPQQLLNSLIALSRWCLITAIAAIGMKTILQQLIQVGAKAISLMVLETLTLAIFVVLMIRYF
jgi:uncharacterized integral membrane protein (TIGR00698 family)